MICKNCGANIRNKENYCPNCGMELMVSYSKSLKEKYIAGEYHDHRDDLIIKDRYDQKSQKEEFEPVKHSYETEDYYGNETLEEYETGENWFICTFCNNIIFSCCSPLWICPRYDPIFRNFTFITRFFKYKIVI